MIENINYIIEVKYFDYNKLDISYLDESLTEECNQDCHHLFNKSYYFTKNQINKLAFILYEYKFSRLNSEFWCLYRWNLTNNSDNYPIFTELIHKIEELFDLKEVLHIDNMLDD